APFSARASNGRHGCAGGVSLGNHTPLLGIERRRPPERHPALGGPQMPACVLLMISDRSNSAKPPCTVSMSLPCGVVVSHQASASERKPATFPGAIFLRGQYGDATGGGRCDPRLPMLLPLNRPTIALQGIYRPTNRSLVLGLRDHCSAINSSIRS